MGETVPLIPGEPPVLGQARGLLFVCLFSLCFLSSADSTMVSTLLGQISHDLKAQERISWVATSYLLACATFQPLFGKLSDVFGRKIMILLCISLFTIGCAICGWAPNFNVLVMGRFITGIGGGGLSSLITIVMSDLVSLRDRGLYNGYIGIFLDLGAISGGVLAGIIDKLFGWQWSFWCQVPICIVIGVVIWLYFNVDKDDGVSHIDKLKSIDWVGSIILTSSLFSLLVVTSVTLSSTLWFGLSGYCIIGFTSFYIYESKCDNAIIPVALLHNPTISITCINWWFMCSNFYTYVFYLPFYWSSVQGKSALQCGYLFIPSTIISTFAALFTGWVLKIRGEFRSLHLLAGFLISVGSLIIYALKQESSELFDSIVSLPLRFGTTINHSVMLIAMLSSVDPQQQALVTSIQYGFKSMGSTMGLAISNYIMQKTLDSGLSNAENIELPDGWSPEKLHSVFQEAKRDPQLAFGLPEVVKSAILTAYDKAGHWVFSWLIFSGVICYICVLLTPKRAEKL